MSLHSLGSAPSNGVDNLFDTLRAALAHYLATGNPASAEEGTQILAKLQGLFDRPGRTAICGDSQAHQSLLAHILLAISEAAIAPSSLQARDITRDLERLSHIPESVLGQELQRTVIRLAQDWRERQRRAATIEFGPPRME